MLNKNNLKQFIIFVGSIIICLICFIFTKYIYIKITVPDIELAQNILIDYNIIDNNDLSSQYIDKETFIRAFMRVLGATDKAIKEFEIGNYSQQLGSDEYSDGQEVISGLGYFYAANFKLGIDIFEKDGRVHPRQIVTVSQALDYMHSILPSENVFVNKLNLMKDKMIFCGYKKLKKDDFIVLLYIKLKEKRFLYFDREKIFDSTYTYDYQYKSENSYWNVYKDENRTITYCQMHKNLNNIIEKQ